MFPRRDNVEIPFGPHRGQLLAEVPIAYLHQLLNDISMDFDLLLDVGFELKWRELNTKIFRRRRRRK